MSYRYPFTPYPKGWYHIKPKGDTVTAFGKSLTLKHSILSETKRTFPTIQRNGLLYAFYDRDQDAPYYDIPEIAEFSCNTWQKPFFLSWKTRIHVQEIVENALDLAHFCRVHTYTAIPVLSRFQMNQHQFNVLMHSERNLFRAGIAKVSMDITYHGMGVVISDVISNDVQLKVLLTITPTCEEWVDIDMMIAIKKTKNPLKNCFLRYYLPHDIYHEFSLDIPIWEKKIYRSKPLLCIKEANIIRIRKWAQQFY